jgi:hypothetical protein
MKKLDVLKSRELRINVTAARTVSISAQEKSNRNPGGSDDCLDGSRDLSSVAHYPATIRNGFEELDLTLYGHFQHPEPPLHFMAMGLNKQVSLFK